jgi:acyl carrier protein
MALTDEERAYVERSVTRNVEKYIDGSEKVNLDSYFSALGFDSMSYVEAVLSIEEDLETNLDEVSEYHQTFHGSHGDYNDLQVSDLVQEVEKFYEESRVET